ncbi:MAG: phosphate signaling complex protein PhoU [Alphaproteobacteria bacterium]|nr:phosphate signaling complex protein PhoU [Alphaproteobacteria bacterium]
MTVHIVKSFDEELNRMTGEIAQMGGFVEEQIMASVNALVRRDSDKAQEVIAKDKRIDALEDEVEQMALRLLALRQPLAADLRLVTTAVKIAADLERMGDYAANVAKRALTLNKLDPVRPVNSVPRIAELVQGMVKDVLDAFVERDVEKALAVWRRDEDVDAYYNSLFRELLTYMMEDPHHITPCIHMLFIAKNLERIGDHATNIAEQVNFLVRGKPVEEARPKGDLTAYSTPES